MRISAERVLTVFLFATSALAFGASRIVARYGGADTPLQEFYVSGLSRTLMEAGALLIAGAVFCGIYAIFPNFRNTLHVVTKKIGAYLRTCSLLRYALISFSSAAAVLFLLNSPGIIYGTFLIDDYEMYAIATERSVWELFWIPINGHVIPLFWLELKVLFFFTGPNAPFLNFPLFIPAIIAIGGAATLLRQLGFGPMTLAVLLVTFGSTTIVGHQLFGFYAVAPYMQVLAVFILALIVFVQSQQSPRHYRLHQILSLTLLTMTLLIESGAVWTPFAYVMFVYAFRILTFNAWSIREAIGEYAGTMIATLAIASSYAAYLIVLPRYTTEVFYGFNQLPISFGTILELYRVLAEGVLLSLFAPRLGLIVSQPRFADFIVFWHGAVLVLFLACICIFAYAMRKSSVRARVLVPCFLLVVLGTSLLVAIARPSSNPAAFYRDQNLLFPLFFLALALAVFAHEWLAGTVDKSKQHAREVVITAFLILVFVSQHIFSFYKTWYMDDIRFNRAFVERLRETLVPAINEMADSAPEPIAVPSLSALFLQGGEYRQLHELSDFSSFIGIRNVMWLPISQGPYGASTSPLFIGALKHDPRLREWYLANGELYERCGAEPTEKGDALLFVKEPILVAKEVNTAHAHTMYVDLEARNAPEKIFIEVAFGNNFNATGTRGYIRIDQYTKRIDADVRRYVCAVDLNELPAFALSPLVSDLTIAIPTSGEYRLAAFINKPSVAPAKDQ